MTSSSCCGPSGGSDADRTSAAATVTGTVREKYADVAASTLSGTHAGVQSVAEAFGYSAEELASIPAEANMGLSCGNPTAMANLREGETVVDLGCGGGLDVLLAAKKVGPTGRAIGIDMTPEMIDRARKNSAGLENVEFHLAQIDDMPLADASVDCVISNCVINLAPDKPAVFREIARVLKPGGRLAVSDIALRQVLPKELADSVAAYVGCIAGAIPMSDYEQQLKEAGFEAVQVVDSGADLNAYAKVENQQLCCAPPMDEPAAPPPSGGRLSLAVAGGSCCGGSSSQSSTVHGGLAELLERYDVNDYAASCKIFAVKPL